jgi:hypothetical protein
MPAERTYGHIAADLITHLLAELKSKTLFLQYALTAADNVKRERDALLAEEALQHAKAVTFALEDSTAEDDAL